jgi:hypothetical protein
MGGLLLGYVRAGELGSDSVGVDIFPTVPADVPQSQVSGAGHAIGQGCAVASGGLIGCNIPVVGTGLAGAAGEVVFSEGPHPACRPQRQTRSSPTILATASRRLATTRPSSSGAFGAETSASRYTVSSVSVQSLNAAKMRRIH